MDVIKTMQPGTHGTIRYTNKWKDQLVAVRYRKDSRRNQVYTTIEIVVDKRELRHRPFITPKIEAYI